MKKIVIIFLGLMFVTSAFSTEPDGPTIGPGHPNPGREVVSFEEVMRPDPVAGLGAWKKAYKITFVSGEVIYVDEDGQSVK